MSLPFGHPDTTFESCLQELPADYRELALEFKAFTRSRKIKTPAQLMCVFQSIRPPIPGKIRPLIPVEFGHPFQWGFGRRFRAIRPDRRRAATWEENCYWLTGVAVKGVRVFRRDSPFKCRR